MRPLDFQRISEELEILASRVGFGAFRSDQRIYPYTLDVFDPDVSVLVKRILSDDPQLVMPPPRHPVKLKQADKDAFIRRIEQGAKYERHWAFQKSERPDAPSDVKGHEPIDAFIEVRREEAGLKGNDEASREALLRRLSPDLADLQPTVAEVEAFLNDKEEDAYECQVDRLLASEHRMAMWWLDGARYADTHGFQTHGFQADWERYQGPWRDWVIKALKPSPAVHLVQHRTDRR